MNTNTITLTTAVQTLVDDYRQEVEQLHPSEILDRVHELCEDVTAMTAGGRLYEVYPTKLEITPFTPRPHYTDALVNRATRAWTRTSHEQPCRAHSYTTAYANGVIIHLGNVNGTLAYYFYRPSSDRLRRVYFYDVVKNGPFEYVRGV